MFELTKTSVTTKSVKDEDDWPLDPLSVKIVVKIFEKSHKHKSVHETCVTQ